MTNVDRQKLWDDFLAAWPAERLRQMTLEEYTNPDKDDAFIYWVEARLQELGSIWGSVAFKFGIYCRTNTEAKDSGRGRVYGDKYGWWEKYGKTEQEAFATVRGLLGEVLQAVRDGNLARIEEIDLSPMFKWKVACLYQDRKNPVLFPIYKKDALFFHYRMIDPSAKLISTPYHVMYETLMERHRELGDVFAIASELWQQFELDRTRTRAWAVPLTWTVDAAAIEDLCSKERVEPEDVDSFLENMLSAVELSDGDQMALLVDGDVRALGKVTSSEPGLYSWEQVPVNFPSGLLVNPTSEVRELDASESQEIWSHLPKAQADSRPSPGPRYWKIAPGSNGVAWSEWKKREIVAIGWSKLGDLSKCKEAEFRTRAKAEYGKGEPREGPFQVWTFREIRPGDRVVANQGTHSVLGIGTVLEGYRFRPGKHIVDGENFPHQIKVRWDDTTRRAVAQGGWRRTLLELSKEEFEKLTGPTDAKESVSPPADSPALPCEPRNVIVYGPPGTGKTYSTVRRALELILGREKLEGLTEKGLMALFREHQARGQIEFVTFHQAYGYEEFVEGIRPVLGRGAETEVRYELHDGVFKRIALSAAVEGLRAEATKPDFDELWDFLVREVQEKEQLVVQSRGGKGYWLGSDTKSAVTVNADSAENTVSSGSDAQAPISVIKEQARIYWNGHGLSDQQGVIRKQLNLGEGTVAAATYNALGLVHSQLLRISRSEVARKADSSYVRSRVQQALDKPGPTTTFTFTIRSPQYVLIIDEINRGNMSKILGELITLLEPDKRLTGPNELKLPLSYSPHHRFAVPPNLHVLGTMNTADRSIALMDVALRRRFTFEELMPDSSTIRAKLQDRVPSKPFIDLVVDLFEALNNRIRFLYDRDHQLGHSYFLEAIDPEALRLVFVDRIIPMLQEYFYGAWDKICIVLGCPYNDAGEAKRRDAHLLETSNSKSYLMPFITASAFPEVRTLGFDHEDYEDRVDYRICAKLRGGKLKPEELFRSYLGVLALDAATHKRRLSDLLPELAAGA